jgi:DUF4097 and DUF4098 domain-containing protein YvlB
MDEHISRILRMLEEGKISAVDAEKLISTLSAKQAAPPPPPPPPPVSPVGFSPPPPPVAERPEKKAETNSSAGEDQAGTHPFGFEWSQKKNFPFDLSSLGKQISDAVKKIDPEKIVREAKTGVSRGGKRWQDKVRHWTRYLDGEEGRPENTLGLPASRATETLLFEVMPNATLHVENRFGAVTVLGGGDAVSIEVEKEAWDDTEEEAAARLKELKAETMSHQMPGVGATRLEVKVTAPEDWRDGYANLRIRVPVGVTLRVETVFGEIRVEGVTGEASVHTVSGAVSLENLGGDTRVEGISGEMRAVNIGGELHMAGKSGDIHVENLAKGGSVVGVSGDVLVRGVEGAKLEAKSVSGDVRVEDVGRSGRVETTVESVSGDVRLSRASGVVTLKTVSGDASAEDLTVTMLQAQTVSGDVTAKVSGAFDGTITANTVSGDVSLRLPGAAGFRFTLGTQTGEMRCGLAARDAHQTSTLYTGIVGGGEGTVTVHTRSGDVSLTPEG